MDRESQLESRFDYPKDWNDGKLSDCIENALLNVRIRAFSKTHSPMATNKNADDLNHGSLCPST